MRTIRALAMTTAALLAAAAPAHAGWQQPSDVQLDAQASAHARSTTAVAVGGVPHVAWTEGSESVSSIKAARMRPDGTWEAVASELSAPGALAIEPSVASVGGQLLVAWAERPERGVFQVRVAKLTETGWEQVGGLVNRQADVEARDPDIIGVAGVPHVAWIESDAENLEVRVAKLSGSSWEQVGGLVNNSSRAAAAALIPSLEDQYGAYEPDLAVDASGVLHVAFIEGGATGDARVARLVDGAWREYGAAQAPLGSGAAQIDLVTIAGVPFAAWRQASGSWGVRVARLAGETWQAVGDAVLPAGGSAEPSLLDTGGRPWLAYVDGGSDVRVVRLAASGTAWEQPVDAPLEDVRTKLGRTPALFLLDGIPWATWSEGYLTSAQDVRAARLVPDFLSIEATASGTSATLMATLRTFGLTYPAGFAFGPAGGTLAGRTALTAASGEEATIAATLTGLEPRTAYEAQALAVAGPEVSGPVVGFTTTKRNGRG